MDDTEPDKTQELKPEARIAPGVEEQNEASADNESSSEYTPKASGTKNKVIIGGVVGGVLLLCLAFVGIGFANGFFGEPDSLLVTTVVEEADEDGKVEEEPEAEPVGEDDPGAVEETEQPANDEVAVEVANSNPTPSQETSNSSSSGNTSSPSSTAQPEPVVPATISVSVAIDATNGNGGSSSTTVTLTEGSSVADALRATGANAEIDGTGYVRAINGLAEKEHGSMSGWHYYVNGVKPLMASTSYKLYGGESIRWFYTLVL